MFVEDQEYMSIVIYYKKEGRHYLAYNDKTFDAMDLEDEQRKEFEKLTVQARPLTWGLYNDMQETAMIPDEFGNRKWNYKVYKETKLRKIIASWDAKMKDADGKVIKALIKPNIISKMSPEIAEVLINTYDQMTLIDDDAEKKS